MERDRRQRYLDIVKGISILCITLLHYENGIFSELVNQYIGAFMVPMFYFVSGWLNAMNDRDMTLKELCKKRWQQLAKPYIYWSGIILCFDTVLFFFGYYDTYFMAREMYKTVVLRGIGTLWFLPVLFGGEILWHLVKRKGWAIVSVICIGYAYQYCYHLLFANAEGSVMQIIEAPFCVVNNVITAYIIIVVGYYCYYVLSRFSLKMQSEFVLGILLLIISVLTLNVSLFPYCQSIIECAGLLLLFKGVPDSKIWDYFDYWGRNSLSLMVTHYSITLVLSSIIVKCVFGLEFLGGVTLVAFAVSMVVQYLMTLLLIRYFPFLLGRRR